MIVTRTPFRVTLGGGGTDLPSFYSQHGGFIFALADSAFAFACNSRNEAAVASACHIDYLEPSAEGDVLTAEAVEQALAGRAGVYDISITNQAGRTIALFRGKSIQLKQSVMPA